MAKSLLEGETGGLILVTGLEEFATGFEEPDAETIP